MDWLDWGIAADVYAKQHCDTDRQLCVTWNMAETQYNKYDNHKQLCSGPWHRAPDGNYLVNKNVCERDSMGQERVATNQLKNYLREKLDN